VRASGGRVRGATEKLESSHLEQGKISTESEENSNTGVQTQKKKTKKKKKTQKKTPELSLKINGKENSKKLREQECRERNSKSATSKDNAF